MTMTPPALDDALAVLRHLDERGERELFEVACAAAGTQLAGLRLRSIHHRPGRSVSRVHEATLEVDGEHREVLLVAHVDARGLPEGAFALRRDAAEVAVWRFPHDPYLPGLPSAIDPGRMRELLDRLGAPDGEVRLHTRAYRPSRRGVVEVRLEGGAASGHVLYLKVLAGERASELAGLHRLLAPYAPVPRVVGVSAAQGILAMEALPGLTLTTALVQGAPLPDPDALVALSTRVAASGVDGRRDPRAFADPVRHVAALVELVPERAQELTRVAAAAAAVDAPRVGVHGDLHGGQLLLDDAGAIVGLLDVDGAGQGLLAHDAGNLVAHLEVLGEVHPHAAERARSYAAEVAAAYRPLVGADALARATAAAWIALATGPHRSQDLDWRERTNARLDHATALVDS